MRSHRHRRVAVSESQQTQALLHTTDRTRSLAQTLADGAGIAMAPMPTRTACGSTRTDEAGAVNVGTRKKLTPLLGLPHRSSVISAIVRGI